MKTQKLIAMLMTMVIILTNIPIAHADPVYYPACSQNHTSIVEALVEVGEKGDYATRAKIAAANDIESYSGTYQQNLTLLSLLRSAQLRRPDIAASASSKPNASVSQSSASNTTPSSGSTTFSASNTPPLTSNYYSAAPQAHGYFDATEVFGFRGVIFVSVKNSAPIRARPQKTGKVLYKLEEGEPIQAISMVQNRSGNRWIQTFIPGGDGQVGYVYIGNTQKHEHSYVDLAEYGYEGYAVCTGCATVVNSEPAEISVDNIHLALALLSMEQTIGNAFDVVDGLIYIVQGDILSAGLSFAAALPGVAAEVDALQLGKASTAVVHTTIRGVDVASAITKVGNNAINIVSRANTKVLGRNMEAAFLKTGDFRFFKWSDQIDMASKSWAAHHIVAGNAKEAEAARQILKAVEIDINAAENGVFLCMKSGVCNGTIHAGGHSNAYYEAVNEALTTAYESYYTMSEKKAAVIAALNDIAVQLRKGDLRL